jgi:SHS2 domain-containing protein
MRYETNLITGKVTEHEDAEVVITHESPEQIQARINAESLAYLESTDWYVVRFAETGIAIPDDIATARQEARDAIV